MSRDLEVVDHGRDARSARAAFGYEPSWGVPGPAQVDALRALVEAPAGG